MGLTWSDVADTISEYAPAVGAALTGNYAGAVGAVVATALGKGDDPTPDAVNDLLMADPEKARALADLNIAEIQANVDLTQAYLEDSASARELHVALASDGRRDFVNMLSGGILIGGILMILSIVYIPTNGLSENIQIYILGFLTSTMGQVVNHYYGVTRNSAKTIPTSTKSAQNLYDQINTRK